MKYELKTDRLRGSAEGPFADAAQACAAIKTKSNLWPHEWRVVLFGGQWFIQVYAIHE